jgi:hypothetical protein
MPVRTDPQLCRLRADFLWLKRSRKGTGSRRLTIDQLPTPASLESYQDWATIRLFRHLKAGAKSRFT